MQHDVDYSVCGNKPKTEQLKCKNEADKSMVKSSDAIPWEKKTMGSCLGQNNDLYQTKTWRWSAVKKRTTALSSDWSKQLAEELHKPITKKKRFKEDSNLKWD